MKNTIFKITVIILSCFMFNVISCSKENSNTISQDNPVSKQGCISFILHTDKTYSNGNTGQVFNQTLVELPGLGKCILERSYYAVFIYFQWENDEIHKGFYLILKDLPGPQKYAFQFTWDAKNGLSDGYMNGILFRKENTRYYKPWKVKGVGTQFNIPGGPIEVADVNIFSKFLPKDNVEKQVPKELHGKMAHLLHLQNLPSPIDVSKKKGKLLYASRMDDETSVKDWVLEGPAEIKFEDNSMIMRSQIPNPPDVSTGHFNYWCPTDFPESFIAEWEFKPINEQGCCHIFFAARGENGEDIFDPSLPKRDGHYSQYHSGSIKNYYIIYFSNRRVLRTSNMATTWLFKSKKSATLMLGQIAVTPGVKKFHRLCLIKESARIQLLANDKVYLDFTDPGSEKWGPVLGGGKIGFRQMAVSVGVGCYI